MDMSERLTTKTHFFLLSKPRILTSYALINFTLHRGNRRQEKEYWKKELTMEALRHFHCENRSYGGNGNLDRLPSADIWTDTDEDEDDSSTNSRSLIHCSFTSPDPNEKPGPAFSFFLASTVAPKYWFRDWVSCKYSKQNWSVSKFFLNCRSKFEKKENFEGLEFSVEFKMLESVLTSVPVCRCHRQNVSKFYFLKFLFIKKLWNSITFPP